MTMLTQGVLVRIFVGESDRHEGRPLYEAAVLRAREMGLAGATVFRGVMGYGAHSRLHAAKVLRLSEDLPMVVEVVDTEENVGPFLEWVDGAVTEGLVMLEQVRVHLYRTRGG